jgi:hypothetical protein
MTDVKRDTIYEQIGKNWTPNENPLTHIQGRKVRFLTKGSKPFAIGSCFAVNVSKWLRYQGLEFIQPSWGLHYNTRTILYEIKRCLRLDVPEVTWEVKRNGRTSYVDGLRHTVNARTISELSNRREKIAADIAQSFQMSDSMIMTFGLSEVWSSEQCDGPVILNRAPYSSAKELDGFINRFMSVEECERDILEIIRMVRKEKGAEYPIVISLSPVPMARSSSRFPPSVANVRSKSTLLLAIHNILEQMDPGFSYLPSYEYFQVNPSELNLWQRDKRHPTSEAVNDVCKNFALAFSNGAFEIKEGFEVVQVLENGHAG